MQSKSSWPSDIWSVGATAVELAEGGPPYCEFPATRAMTEISLNGFLGFRNVDYFSEAFTDFVFTCMEKDPRQRPTAEQLLEHPFIKQIETLDRVEIFEDLPETTIDFAKLLEIAEEEEEKGEGEGGGDAVVPLPKPAESKTLSAVGAENVRRKVGYATFRPPAPADATPQAVYRKPEARPQAAAPLSVIPPGGRQPTSLPTADPAIILPPINPPPPPADKTGAIESGSAPIEKGPSEPIEKVQIGGGGAAGAGAAAAAPGQGSGVPWHVWVIVGLALPILYYFGRKKGIVIVCFLFLGAQILLSRNKKEKQE